MAEGDIGKDFSEDAAEAEHDDRTERRIDLSAQNAVDALRRHFRDNYPVESCRRNRLSDRFHNPGIGSRNIVRRDVQGHTADIGLVGDIRRGDLERIGAGTALGIGACRGFVAQQRIGDDRQSEACEDFLGFPLAERRLRQVERSRQGDRVTFFARKGFAEPGQCGNRGNRPCRILEDRIALTFIACHDFRLRQDRLHDQHVRIVGQAGAHGVLQGACDHFRSGDGGPERQDGVIAAALDHLLQEGGDQRQVVECLCGDVHRVSWRREGQERLHLCLRILRHR